MWCNCHTSELGSVNSRVFLFASHTSAEAWECTARRAVPRACGCWSMLHTWVAVTAGDPGGLKYKELFCLHGGSYSVWRLAFLGRNVESAAAGFGPFSHAAVRRCQSRAQGLYDRWALCASVDLEALKKWCNTVPVAKTVNVCKCQLFWRRRKTGSSLRLPLWRSLRRAHSAPSSPRPSQLFGRSLDAST